jgi:hypothetical protein
MTPATAQDLSLAALVHEAIGVMAEPTWSRKPAYRVGDRKVFISALHRTLCQLNPAPHDGAQLTLGELKAWLLTAMRLHDSAGLPLVLLARADLVASMDSNAVAESETEHYGATFHFVLDRDAGAADYAACRHRPRVAAVPMVTPDQLDTRPMRRVGRIGGGR